MSFVNQFATYFTAQQRNTELYQLWSTIGQNMEKSILEEQGKLNTEFTDINNFSEDTLRSWLAFFLMRIPYRTTATCQVKTSMPGNFQETEIPQYAELVTDDGITYTQMEKVTLSQGDTRVVTAVQGIRVVENGTYNSIIKIQATNPDLTYLTVKINGKDIPEVSYETSYDQLLYRGAWKPEIEEGHEWGGTPFLQNQYGKKGEFYSVIDSGSAKFSTDGVPMEFVPGDLVVFDGQQWQKMTKNNNLSPIQFANSYAVPRNGYFAYYYGGYLYIKIFSGSDITDPNGQPFEVSYIQSDGVQGELEEIGRDADGKLLGKQLRYVSSYEDIDENVVELEVSNTPSTTAVNEPSVGKLGLYLKQRLYSSINVASVPEYTMWFKAQPEVGDCLVLSDYEKFVRAGKDYGKYTPTGIVDVYLVDPSGKTLMPEIKEELLDRLEPFKDVAVVVIKEFTRVEQYLKFEFTTSSNDDQFRQYVKSKASQYYNLSYLQSTNSSIFADLDLAAIVKDIQVNSPYDSTGLILKGYHYQKGTYRNTKIQTEAYDGEKQGSGWYIFTVSEADPPIYIDENNNEVRSVRFEEIESAEAETTCYIYYSSNGSSIRIGSHVGNMVDIDVTGIFEFTSATLECFWGMKNEGVLAIGLGDGLRALHEIDVEKVQADE